MEEDDSGRLYSEIRLLLDTGDVVVCQPNGDGEVEDFFSQHAGRVKKWCVVTAGDVDVKSVMGQHERIETRAFSGASRYCPLAAMEWVSSEAALALPVLRSAHGG